MEGRAMNIAEIVSIFGIFVVVWWIGRRAADAFDRYELMKDQRKTKENGRLEAVRRRGITDRGGAAMQPGARPPARASGSR